MSALCCRWRRVRASILPRVPRKVSFIFYVTSLWQSFFSVPTGLHYVKERAGDLMSILQAGALSQATHNSGLLQEYATPGSGINIGNGLRERPAVTTQIFHSVLPFAIGVIGWGIDNAYPGLRGMGIVAV